MNYFFTAVSVFIFSLFLIITSPFVFMSLLFNKTKQKELMYFYWKYFSLFVMHFICLSRVSKRDLRSSISKQTLFISNHKSLMDIPLFASNHQVTPLMKAEILRIPIIGLAAKMTGAITVSRKDNNSRTKAFRLCLKALASGTNMLFFPEGTRSIGPTPKDISKINTPLIQYAYKMNIPVTPVSIYGSEKIITKKGTINYFAPVAITTHPELYPKDFSTDQEFISACWNCVCQGFVQLESAR